MRFLVAVIVVALAVLYALTALALEAGGALRHRRRTLAALVALLVLGLVLLAE
jgi:hypothetical protein